MKQKNIVPLEDGSYLSDSRNEPLTENQRKELFKRFVPKWKNTLVTLDKEFVKLLNDYERIEKLIKQYE